MRNQIFCLIAVVLAAVAATSPVPGQIVIPDGAVIPPVDESLPGAAEAEDKIQQTLRQRAPGKPSNSTGDPILDDVLDQIRQRGSLLNRSVLDAGREDEIVPSHGDSKTSRSTYVAAESLLRTARILAGLQDRNSEHQELIVAMRTQAAKLLIDAISRQQKALGTTP